MKFMARIVKKSQERRSEIIKCARRLFQTQEYDKTSMQDIMDELNIAKGTIYHYFKSKEDLLMAVIEDIAQESIAAMQKLLKKPVAALEKMKSLITAASIASDNTSIMEVLHRSANNAMHTRLLGALLVRQAPLYAEVISQGCKEGIFTTDAPLECAEFIISAVQFLTDLGIYPWTKEDLERRVNAFPKLIEKQLSAPAGSFNFLLSHIAKA